MWAKKEDKRERKGKNRKLKRIKGTKENWRKPLEKRKSKARSRSKEGELRRRRRDGGNV